jgi:D-arabinose 1-dehydrogenase-like Zn-dependent alcohol dehydrogenase
MRQQLHRYCAGVTTWSPLRHWNVKKGDKVGVVGLGGLAIWVLNLLMH